MAASPFLRSVSMGSVLLPGKRRDGPKHPLNQVPPATQKEYATSACVWMMLRVDAPLYRLRTLESAEIREYDHHSQFSLLCDLSRSLKDLLQLRPRLDKLPDAEGKLASLPRSESCSVPAFRKKTLRHPMSSPPGCSSILQCLGSCH